MRPPTVSETSSLPYLLPAGPTPRLEISITCCVRLRAPADESRDDVNSSHLPSGEMASRRQEKWPRPAHRGASGIGWDDCPKIKKGRGW